MVMAINDYSEDFLLMLYKKMLRIRRFEEKAVACHSRGEIPGNLHPCIGEEASVVGACSAIEEKDFITSTHRGHGHCLAKGARCDFAFAELFGKNTGYCKGKGGSLHLVDIKKGILGANGIVGAGMPIGTGAAMVSKVLGSDEVAICFFGDGASNQGTFHEALNMASAWHLPVIFFCENNGWAVSVSIDSVTNVQNIAQRASAYNIPGVVVDGMDVLAVYEATKEAVERARKGYGPTLIESKVFLFAGHCCGDPGNYRPASYYEEARSKDPVANFKKRLLELHISGDVLDSIHRDVADEIEKAYQFALDSPFPSPEEAFTDTYAKDNERSIAR